MITQSQSEISVFGTQISNAKTTKTNKQTTYMIGIRIPLGPILILPILLILILVPKFLNTIPHLLGSTDLLKSQFCIILHPGRLSQRHLHTILLGDFAGGVSPSITVVIITTLHEFIIFRLFIS